MRSNSVSFCIVFLLSLTWLVVSVCFVQKGIQVILNLAYTIEHIQMIHLYKKKDYVEI